VIYPTSGTYIASCVVDKERVLNVVRVNGFGIGVSGLVIDHKCYYYETDTENEAYYLSCLLNSPLIDEDLKDMQARGLFGPRHIHKKVLEFPFPKFSPRNEIHGLEDELQRISELTAEVLPELEGQRG